MSNSRAFLVGREREISLFREALEGSGTRAFYVHGPGGVGKTSLLIHLDLVPSCYVRLRPGNTPSSALECMRARLGHMPPVDALTHGLASPMAGDRRAHASGPRVGRRPLGAPRRPRGRRSTRTGPACSGDRPRSRTGMDRRRRAPARTRTLRRCPANTSPGDRTRCRPCRARRPRWRRPSARTSPGRRTRSGGPTARHPYRIRPGAPRRSPDRRRGLAEETRVRRWRVLERRFGTYILPPFFRSLRFSK